MGLDGDLKLDHDGGNTKKKKRFKGREKRGETESQFLTIKSMGKKKAFCIQGQACQRVVSGLWNSVLTIFYISLFIWSLAQFLYLYFIIYEATLVCGQTYQSWISQSKYIVLKHRLARVYAGIMERWRFTLERE